MSELKRYAAFISYSSKDAAFAKRLHRSLESYRIPPQLGSFALSSDSRGKNRLYPCFLDRVELPSGDLNESIKNALGESGALIVICSPNAAKSDWVNKEILFYQSLGRGDRIFAVIAGGEPGVAQTGNDAAECFPVALRTDARVRAGEAAPLELLAGDARRGFDGFRNAWLKVLAGILRVNLGSLINRDAVQKRRRLIRIATLAGATATLIGILTTAWILQSNRADEENRTRLVVNMRAAFENGDETRGATILTHLYADMTPEEQAKNSAVLGAWLPRWPDRAAVIANLENGTVFRAGERMFLKELGKVRALPFDIQTAVAVGNDGVIFAIDREGKFWRAKPGGRPEEIRLAAALDLNIVWQAGRVDGSRVSFVGAAPSIDDYDDEDDTRAAPLQQCATIDPATGVVEMTEVVFTHTPQDDGTPCGVRTQSLDTIYADIDAQPPVEQPERLESANAPDEAVGDLAALCASDEPYQLCGTGDWFHFTPQGSGAPVLIRLHTAGDAGVAQEDVCILIPTDTQPVCVSPGVRSSGARVFDRFVYLRDWAYEVTQPMFRLVDRRDATLHDFTMQSLRDKYGGSPGYVAISKSGQRLAMVVNAEILVFNLENGIIPKLTSRFSGAGLRGPATFGALAFVNESAVVVSRSSGLTLAYDLATNSELWRFRLLSSHETFEGANVNAIVSKDGARILVSGDTYASVLDASTGLPVQETFMFDFAPVPRYDEVNQAEAAFFDARNKSEKERARLRWRQVLREVSSPTVLAEDDGAFVVKRGSSDVWRLKPPAPHPQDAAMFAAARCRTGWEVRGGNVVSFDLLEGLKSDGPAVSTAEISARCAGAR
ncbi:toll/interleukin-1 receptor domain-containing protein [Pseudomonas sp. NPDC089392]|uniref:toll/interleukin-1 receptor domain-containing protein n=1 Tax=Pseudomonas sp. NPDC089392 TaxID=3364459 RepID=UPI0037F607ED